MFYFFISGIILLRIVELIVSRNNEKWLLRYGAIEYGKKHYPYMVAMHALFFISLIFEHNTQQMEVYNPSLFIIYIILIISKIWVISLLGKFWSTKIYHIAGIPTIKKGAYKYVKHPNYMIVIAEIIVIPLTFNLYYTAVIFSILNAMMLYVRIREENRALQI